MESQMNPLRLPANMMMNDSNINMQKGQLYSNHNHNQIKMINKQPQQQEERSPLLIQRRQSKMSIVGDKRQVLFRATSNGDPHHHLHGNGHANGIGHANGDSESQFQVRFFLLRSKSHHGSHHFRIWFGKRDRFWEREDLVTFIWDYPPILVVLTPMET
jgi:hypothetical protein